MRPRISLLSALLPFVAAGSLPYNPSRVISVDQSSLAYIFSPLSDSSGQFSFSVLDASGSVNSSSQTISTISPSLPFLSTSTSKAFIPLANSAGDLTVLAGDCSKGAHGMELWRFLPSTNWTDGTWLELQLTLTDATLSANFLSAGFAFSATTEPEDASVYIFGGMCPNVSTSTAADWTTNASYSNTMLTIYPDATFSPSESTSLPYGLSMTGVKAPPIAEAGLSITPLVPTYSNLSSGTLSQQQNFVLLGGHTQSAFINMSQVALFSLPQQSWSFLGVNSPASNAQTELFARDSTDVDPRSGHTAVLAPDGTKIIVFGGWVGDISTPATPQLAILEVGQGFGGDGDWAWTVPTQASNPFASGDGLYGHAATMLPGGVMMIVGGYRVSESLAARKRSSADSNLLFFNITSSTWISTYTNPKSPDSPAYTGTSSEPLRPSTRQLGLGAGLGFGLLALVGILLVWYFYSRRLRQRRAIREKDLRELALGTDQYHATSVIDGGVDGRGGNLTPEMRSASWGSRQEWRIGNPIDAYPWAPVMSEDQAGRMGFHDDGEDDGLRQAERTGVLVEVPSPTRGLRKSLHSRAPAAYGPTFGSAPSGRPGSVFRIEEEDENSQGGSLRRKKTPSDARTSVQSDPFKDPPPAVVPEPSSAAEERKKEIQGWVEDWNVAAENLSRNTSHATQGRTYSSLSNSQSNSNSQSAGSGSGRGSPDKSDRTGSNLSERSMISNSSIQRSVTGTILSRYPSMRNAGSGYALFAGAAAAMAKMSGTSRQQGPQESYGTVASGRVSLDRAPSKRSASLNFNSTGSSQQGTSQGTRSRGQTFSSARSSQVPNKPTEDSALLSGPDTRVFADDRDLWTTPPESPTKERYGSRTGSLTRSAGNKALGLLGTVKRVLTGTASVDVMNRIAGFEERSGQSSPTKLVSQPQMAEALPRRAASASATYWKGKMGKADWDEDTPDYLETGAWPPASSKKKRQSLPGQLSTSSSARDPYQEQHDRYMMKNSNNNNEDDGGNDLDIDDEDWDVEEAVQRRLVQVMFTVPKEKLRVVNADALSLVSRSSVDFEGGERDDDDNIRTTGANIVKRMSSVNEGDERLVEERQKQLEQNEDAERWRVEEENVTEQWKGTEPAIT